MSYLTFFNQNHQVVSSWVCLPLPESSSHSECSYVKACSTVMMQTEQHKFLLFSFLETEGTWLWSPHALSSIPPPHSAKWEQSSTSWALRLSYLSASPTKEIISQVILWRKLPFTNLKKWKKPKLQWAANLVKAAQFPFFFLPSPPHLLSIMEISFLRISQKRI